MKQNIENLTSRGIVKNRIFVNNQTCLRVG
jgi:hypothetical protein